MFDFLLKPFSPLTAFYNSLVVVNCTFQHFEIKQLCYDPIQADQIVANFNYNPFAGNDEGSLILNDIEQDFTAVDKLMQDVDDDYCLTAAADVVAESATPAQLAGCLRIFVANVIENILFGAILSCDFVLTEKKSIKDFVNVTSKELKRCRSRDGPLSQPKMRGFGVDFGVSGIKCAVVPDTDLTVQQADLAAVVPVYPRWKSHLGNEVLRRRESYTRYNREHEGIDGWGIIINDFSIQATN